MPPADDKPAMMIFSEILRHNIKSKIIRISQQKRAENTIKDRFSTERRS